MTNNLPTSFFLPDPVTPRGWHIRTTFSHLFDDITLTSHDLHLTNMTPWNCLSYKQCGIEAVITVTKSRQHSGFGLHFPMAVHCMSRFHFTQHVTPSFTDTHSVLS